MGGQRLTSLKEGSCPTRARSGSIPNASATRAPPHQNGLPARAPQHHCRPGVPGGRSPRKRRQRTAICWLGGAHRQTCRPKSRPQPRGSRRSLAPVRSRHHRSQSRCQRPSPPYGAWRIRVSGRSWRARAAHWTIRPSTAAWVSGGNTSGGRSAVVGAVLLTRSFLSSMEKADADRNVGRMRVATMASDSCSRKGFGVGNSSGY